MPIKTGIYKITNVSNGKLYIGSATHYRIRKERHKTKLRGDRHENGKLQNAWNKYGEDMFEFEIIEECEKDKLIEREQYWMDELEVVKNGYNICKYARNTLGRKNTKKSIAKFRKTMKERYPDGKPLNSGNFEKGMIPWNKDKIGCFSEESKKKMSESSKGKPSWCLGTKGLMKPNKTSFKKGHTPWNKGKRLVNQMQPCL